MVKRCVHNFITLKSGEYSSFKYSRRKRTVSFCAQLICFFVCATSTGSNDKHRRVITAWIAAIYETCDRLLLHLESTINPL